MPLVLKEKYETVIGLEVHAQLKTKSKIFCKCATNFGAPPNENVCPVCMGLPGVLPVVNKKAVESAILTGLALSCKISEKSKFDRKQYFYPDMPKNYQISQYDMPVAVNGWIEIEGKKIRINRVHLEEDAGKLVHAGSVGLAGSVYSLVDINRAGMPLMEIVSEADIRSADEARQYMTELRNILRYLDVSDGNLEEGSLRCDANISIRPYGQKELGTKTEVKNMNSFRALQKALEYEEERLMQMTEDGETIVQETRLWNEQTGSTSSMRTKEYAHDYRYFPEPDLMPMLIGSDWVNQLKSLMPELPAQKRKRYQEVLGLSSFDASVLVETKELSLFFDKMILLGTSAKAAVNWLTGDVTFYLKDSKVNLLDTKLNPENLSQMIALIETGKISNTIGKQILVELMNNGGNPEELIKELNLGLIADSKELRDLADQVIKENPSQLEKYKSGKTQIIGFFVGQIMKLTQGRADPKLVNTIMKEQLDKQI